MMKQNIEIYLADAAPCTRVALILGISVTEFFNFGGIWSFRSEWRNIV